MNATEDLTEPMVTQRAAEWFIAHRGGALSAAERLSFVAWLKSSPANVREYLAVAGLSGEVASAARSIDVELEILLKEAAEESRANVLQLHETATVEATAATDNPLEKVQSRRRWRYGLAAAVAFISISAATVWSFRDGERFGLPRTYQTAHAEQRTWRLPDGSVMHLNSDTRLTVQFSDGERRIDVDRGQARFRVTHEPARRFRVTAGQAIVVALGTEFDVYRRVDATDVTVVEGRVAVFPQSAPSAKAGEGAEDILAAPSVNTNSEGESARLRERLRAIELTAGQRVRIGSAAEHPAPVAANLRESTAWLQRQIVFEQKPLAEVASEFNRYSRTPIEIDSSELRTLRVSGVFNAYDTESFVAFLGRLDGVAIETDADRIRIRVRAMRSNEPLTAEKYW